MRLGLIADTHGHLDAAALAALVGSDRILHAGDVGEGVLGRLAELAPVTAVRGNNDTQGEAALLPERAAILAEGMRIALVHRLEDVPATGWDVLVYGHCHRQHADREGSKLLLNPGAAGRRGFHVRRSVATLELGGGEVRWSFTDLGPRALAPSRTEVAVEPR